MAQLRLYHKTLIAQHFVTIAAIIFVCFGAYFIGKQVIQTLNSINTTAIDIHSTFDVINKPRTGTLAGVNQVIFGADALIKHSNEILDHEEKQLSTLDKQETILFDDLHTIATNANTEILSLNTTTVSLNTLLGNANNSAEKVPELLGNINKIAVDTDTKINDPHVAAFIANLEPLSKNAVSITGSSAVIAGNFAATTTDFQTKFHEWIYPTPCKTTVCALGKIGKFILDVSKFSEPIYYTQQTIESMSK